MHLCVFIYKKIEKINLWHIFGKLWLRCGMDCRTSISMDRAPRHWAPFFFCDNTDHWAPFCARTIINACSEFGSFFYIFLTILSSILCSDDHQCSELGNTDNSTSKVTRWATAPGPQGGPVRTSKAHKESSLDWTGPADRKSRPILHFLSKKSLLSS